MPILFPVFGANVPAVPSVPSSDKKEKKNFLKEFKAELKRVSWPTPKQIVNNTVAVITIVLTICIVVFVLDVIFESLNTYGVEKLKALVTSSSSDEVVIETDEVLVEGENTEVSSEAETTDAQTDSQTTTETTVVETTEETTKVPTTEETSVEESAEEFTTEIETEAVVEVVEDEPETEQIEYTTEKKSGRTVKTWCKVFE